MKRPNSHLLDVLYRAGAYPFDDLPYATEGGDKVHASTWVIPGHGSVPILLLILGNGQSTGALEKELERLARLLRISHGIEPQSTGRREGLIWTYEVTIMCESRSSRVVQRKMREHDLARYDAFLWSHLSISWFDPPKMYCDNYSRTLDELDLKVDPSEFDVETVEEEDEEFSLPDDMFDEHVDG